MPNVGVTLIVLYFMSFAQLVCSRTSELKSTADVLKSKRSYESASGAERLDNQAVDWPFPPGLGNASLSLSTPDPYHADRIEKVNWRPKVIVLGDNLAVNLTWRSRHSLLRPVKTYHVEYRRRSARSSRWSKPFPITYDPVDKPLVKTFSYITSKHLEAGMVYQFRVRTEFQNGDEERSAWSAKTSFSYISRVPPLLSVATRLPGGAVYVKWVLYKMRVGFPIDHFILLFRKVIRLPNGETGYSGFQYVIVPGHLEEYKVSGLESHSNYMFVVYGVHEPPQMRPSEAIFTGGLNDRKITQFSQEVFVPAETTEPNVVGLNPPSQASDETLPTKPRPFDMNSTSSNSLMFLILGVLAGFMLTVMLALVAVCFCRQHREKLRLLAQMNSNTKDQPNNYTAVPAVGGGTDDQPQPKTGEGAGKTDSRLLVSFQPLHQHHRRRQQPGFLLSDLTPLAVANFRTATPATAANTTLLMTASADSSLQGSRRPLVNFFPSSNTNSPSRTNGDVCSGGGGEGGGGGVGGRGDERHHHHHHHSYQQQQQPMSLTASFHGTTAAAGSPVFLSENTKPPPVLPAPPQRPNDLECTRSAASSCASDSACSSFPPDPPAEVKREPPSGGSIHDESDDDENAVVTTPLAPTKGLSTAFFTQMPFALPAYPTANTFEYPSFIESRHSLSAAAVAPLQTAFGGGRRFSPIIGRRSKLLSPLMEPYPEARTADGEVLTRYGCRRTAAVFTGLRTNTAGEDQALPLLQGSVIFPRTVLGRPGQRSRRVHSLGSTVIATAPLADVELSAVSSRRQSPTMTSTAAAATAALRIQAIVPKEAMYSSAGNRRSWSPTAYVPGLQIARCSGVAADAAAATALGGSSPKEAADVTASTPPQPLPSSARFQPSPAPPGLTQSNCMVSSSSGDQHCDASPPNVRPYQTDAATQTGPLPAYPTDASSCSVPLETIVTLNQSVINDRDINKSGPLRNTEDSSPGPACFAGSELFDHVSVTAADYSLAISSPPAVCGSVQTDFADSADRLHSSPSAVNSGYPTQDTCSPTDCTVEISANEPPVQSQPPPAPRPPT